MITFSQKPATSPHLLQMAYKTLTDLISPQSLSFLWAFIISHLLPLKHTRPLPAWGLCSSCLLSLPGPFPRLYLATSFTFFKSLLKLYPNMRLTVSTSLHTQPVFLLDFFLSYYQYSYHVLYNLLDLLPSVSFSPYNVSPMNTGLFAYCVH